jgi:hypothetical protein
MSRKPGTQNRFTVDIKNAIEVAFRKRNGKDGKGLLELAEKHPAIFYNLVARCIPVTANLELAVTLNLGKAMEQNQLNLDRLQVIEGNVLGTDDTPINELPAKSLKIKDSTK